MHHRSVSSSYAGPSRFRAEAEAHYAKGSACAGTCLARSAKGLADDQIVCQSKLYDAFELQELEQQLDRKLNFLTDHKSRSFSILISDQESFDCKEAQNSESDLPNDRPSPADQPQKHTVCACNFCNSDAKTLSFSSLINDSALPKCKEPLITILRQADDLQAQASCSCNPQANMHDQLQADKKNVRYACRYSYSMPRSHYHGIDNSQAAEPAKSAQLDVTQEALQELQVHADQRAISSTAKELKAQKQIRAKSNRWSLVNSLFRSLKAMHKKQDCMRVLQDGRSTSTSLNLAKQQRNNEYQHHHNIVHYHHVHHHHHHHVVKDMHFEEIDWPLSPARLQELGWLM